MKVEKTLLLTVNNVYACETKHFFSEFPALLKNGSIYAHVTPEVASSVNFSSIYTHVKPRKSTIFKIYIQYKPRPYPTSENAKSAEKPNILKSPWELKRSTLAHFLWYVKFLPFFVILLPKRYLLYVLKISEEWK